MFDLAIIGGGIIGTMAAILAIAAHPSISVALIDEPQSGMRPSDMSMAVDARTIESPARKHLTELSDSATPALAALLPAFNAIRGRSVWVIGEADVDKVLSMVPAGMLGECDSQFEELRRMGVTVPPRSRCFTSPDVCFSHPEQVFHDAGAVIEESRNGVSRQARVVSIYDAGNFVNISPDQGPSLRARKVIVATGSESLTVSRGRSSSRGGDRMKRVVAAHLNTGGRKVDQPVLFESDDAFLRPPAPGGTGAWLCIRGTEWVSTAEPVSPTLRPSEREEVVRLLAKYLPDAGYTIDSAQIAHEMYTETRDPLIISTGNIVHAVGGSGSGFRLSPGIATQALRHAGILHEKDKA